MPYRRHSRWAKKMTVVLAVLVPLSGGLAAASAGPAVAAPTTTSCENFYSTAVANGKYRVQNNVWNDAAGTQCLRVEGTRFDLIRSNHNKPVNGPPASYGSIYKGCHYGLCTASSGFPQQVSSMNRVSADWSTSNIASGAYNTSLDIWFAPRRKFADINAGEIMVWLNHRGGPQPAGARMGSVTIDGVGYDLWKGDLRDDSKGISWVVVSYVRKSHTETVKDLDLRTITRDAVHRGYINGNWYLNSVQAGFEVWHEGKGLRTNSFTVRTQ